MSLTNLYDIIPLDFFYNLQNIWLIFPLCLKYVVYASIKPGHRAKSADLKKLQVWSWQIWKSLDSNQFRQISLVLQGWHWCLEGLRPFDHLRDSSDYKRNSVQVQNTCTPHRISSPIQFLDYNLIAKKIHKSSDLIHNNVFPM